MPYYAYILCNKPRGTLYIGVTNDLVRRVFEHKSGAVKGFTSTYNIHRLVYFEETENVESAIRREKRLKKWPRQWKINAIEKENPNWDDLYEEIAR